MNNRALVADLSQCASSYGMAPSLPSGSINLSDCVTLLLYVLDQTGEIIERKKFYAEVKGYLLEIEAFHCPGVFSVHVLPKVINNFCDGASFDREHLELFLSQTVGVPGHERGELVAMQGSSENYSTTLVTLEGGGRGGLGGRGGEGGDGGEGGGRGGGGEGGGGTQSQYRHIAPGKCPALSAASHCPTT